MCAWAVRPAESFALIRAGRRRQLSSAQRSNHHFSRRARQHNSAGETRKVFRSNEVLRDCTMALLLKALGGITALILIVITLLGSIVTLGGFLLTAIKVLIIAIFVAVLALVVFSILRGINYQSEHSDKNGNDQNLDGNDQN